MNHSLAPQSAWVRWKRPALIYFSLTPLAILACFHFLRYINDLFPLERLYADWRFSLPEESFPGARLALLLIAVSLLTAVLMRTEFREPGFQPAPTSLQPARTKFVMLCLIILLFLVLFSFSLAAAWLLHDSMPLSPLPEQFRTRWGLIWKQLALFDLSNAGILLLIMLAAFRTGSFITPATIGLSLWLTGLCTFYNAGWLLTGGVEPPGAWHQGHASAVSAGRDICLRAFSFGMPLLIAGALFTRRKKAGRR